MIFLKPFIEKKWKLMWFGHGIRSYSFQWCHICSWHVGQDLRVFCSPVLNVCWISKNNHKVAVFCLKPGEAAPSAVQCHNEEYSCVCFVWSLTSCWQWCHELVGSCSGDAYTLTQTVHSSQHQTETMETTASVSHRVSVSQTGKSAYLGSVDLPSDCSLQLAQGWRC